jgi:hypothetical protein
MFHKEQHSPYVRSSFISPVVFSFRMWFLYSKSGPWTLFLPLLGKCLMQKVIMMQWCYSKEWKKSHAHVQTPKLVSYVSWISTFLGSIYVDTSPAETFIRRLLNFSGMQFVPFDSIPHIYIGLGHELVCCYWIKNSQLGIRGKKLIFSYNFLSPVFYLCMITIYTIKVMSAECSSAPRTTAWALLDTCYATPSW